MIFESVRDFADVLGALPTEHPRHRILTLLGEAVRRDVHFIDRHPTTLFQCLWNSCWWYDCPEAAEHYDPPVGGWGAGGPPWAQSGPCLSDLTAVWGQEKARGTPGFRWCRSLRPPRYPLGVASAATSLGRRVTVLAFSPDVQCIAGSSDDGHVRIWEVATGRERVTLGPHARPVGHLAFSPDGAWVAGASRDGTVYLWDAAAGTLRHTLPAAGAWVGGLTFSPDGRTVAVASAQKTGDAATVRLWDVAAGQERARLPTRAGGRPGYSPDGTRLAVGCDGGIRVLDPATGAEVTTLAARAAFESVVYSPDGTHLAAGNGTDYTVHVWDLARGAEMAVLRGHQLDILGIAYSPDGRRLATGSADGTVRVWDAATGAGLAVHRGHDDSVECVAFSADGEQLFSGSADGRVRAWRPTWVGPLPRLRGVTGAVRAVAFSPDGTRLASGSEGDPVAHAPDQQRVHLWDAARGTELGSLPGRGWVAWSPDGSRVATVSMGMLRVWDAASRDAVLAVPWDLVGEPTFSPDWSLVAGVAEDNSVRVTEVATGLPLSRVQAADPWDDPERYYGGHYLILSRERADAVTQVVFSPDGVRVATGSKRGVVRVWQAAGGAELAVLRGPPMPVTAVAFSPDAGRLATAWEDHPVRVWDVGRAEEVGVLAGREGAVRNIAFSEDGHRVIGDSNGQGRVWDTRTGECVAVLLGHGDIRAIAAGESGLPYRALRRGREVVVELTRTGVAVGWLPAALDPLSTHPAGRRWAGGAGSELILFSLEGDGQDSGAGKTELG